MSSPRDVFDAALMVLEASTAAEKVDLTFHFVDLFEKGELPVYSERRGPEDVPVAPKEPAVPTDVELVDPRRVKASTLGGALHSIAHAERYAIDLSWDIVLRFGCRPETWRLGLSKGESDGKADSAGATTSGPPSLLPHQFFVDWLTVAKEEAKHYSLWAARLKALGKPYGSLAGHAGLWESATKTADSLGARLAVVHCVHEARGLDTFLTSRERFVTAGDAEAIKIIDANHLEEIGHVRRGREWLEWLCDQEGEGEGVPLDPKAVYRQLVKAYFVGPLRPPFNEASRDKAGLTKDWWGPLVVAATTSEDKGKKAADDDE